MRVAQLAGPKVGFLPLMLCGLLIAHTLPSNVPNTNPPPLARPLASPAERCSAWRLSSKRPPTCWQPACSEPQTASPTVAAMRKPWASRLGSALDCEAETWWCNGLPLVQLTRWRHSTVPPRLPVHRPSTPPLPARRRCAGTLSVLEERWHLLGALCPVINSSWGENEVLTSDMLVGTLFSLGTRVRAQPGGWEDGVTAFSKQAAA